MSYDRKLKGDGGKQPTMASHSVMLSRLPLNPSYILLGGYLTHLTHSFYLCSVPSVEGTNVPLIG